MNGAAPLFSVVIPSRGDEAKLGNVLAALARQSLRRECFEVVVVLDGVSATPAVATAAAAANAHFEHLERRLGPGAARNRGAAVAHCEFLAFTEDDVTPDPDWLARAAARLESEPALDVLEGLTLKPGAKPVHSQSADVPLYLPTNLFVRRTLFERLGGYDTGFFDPVRGVYFREDSDFGFRLEEAGARVSREPAAIVVHPEEHAGALDPLRWARRYEMDARLAGRHPRRFRERIEVHKVGPFTVRRPIVRAAQVYVLALLGAAVAALFRAPPVAWVLLGLALVAWIPIWAKWRFRPSRLPITFVVPFVLVAALVRGRAHRGATPAQ